jgi:lysozyme
MNSQMRSKLRLILLKHEGYETHPYVDTEKKITIGIGRNLTDNGIRPTEIDMMFFNDTEYFYHFLDNRFDWFAELNEARQIALIDFCFIGTHKFLEFKKMIAALARKDYESAANEVLDSDYAKQVGQRANDIAEILRSGTI